MTEFVTGNRLQLLCSGAEYFPALLSEIERATTEINLETYIFEADPIGREVAAALGAAAKRGVAVYLTVDGFGAIKFGQTLAPALREAGVEIQIYRPELRNWALRRHRLRRLHRKLSVFDRKVAFVGGINIVEDSSSPQLPPRFDYAVRAEGLIVEQIHAAMMHVWHLLGWATLGIKRNVPPAAGVPLPTTTTIEKFASVGNVSAAFLIRDNLRHRRDIERAYLHALQNAREEILIANAYFLPGSLFRRALIHAAKRGVKVTLLLQGQVEHALMHYATLALYARLMRGGVHIVEYRRSFLHAKVAVVDRKWATVGSSNLDPFSLLLSREANLVVDNAEFASELYSSLNSAMKGGGVEIHPADVRGRHWLTGLASELAYGIVRMMIGFSGYGRRRRN